MQKIKLYFRCLFAGRITFWAERGSLYGLDLKAAFPFYAIVSEDHLRARIKFGLIPLSFFIAWAERFRVWYLFQRYGAAGALGREAAEQIRQAGYAAGYETGVSDGLDERIGWGLDELKTSELISFWRQINDELTARAAKAQAQTESKDNGKK